MRESERERKWEREGRKKKLRQCSRKSRIWELGEKAKGIFQTGLSDVNSVSPTV